MLTASLRSLPTYSGLWINYGRSWSIESHARQKRVLQLVSYSRRSIHATIPRHNNVSMQMIKELRKRTGAPIAVVKKALVEESGDLDAAIHYLRKHGAAMAAKKAHRDASEGLIGIAITPDKKKASIVEVNSETDFVARTDQFGQLVHTLSESALSSTASGDTNSVVELEAEQLLSFDDNKSAVSTAVSSLGENIVVRRVAKMSVENEGALIHGYVHGAVGEGNGKIGVLVALEGPNSEELGRRIAMHVAAAAPRFISTDSIPSQVVEKERALLLDAALNESQSAAKPKPRSIIEKMAEGRLKKWYADVVLEEQEMLVEDPSYNGASRSVKEHINTESKGSRILSMSRFSVGDK